MSLRKILRSKIKRQAAQKLFKMKVKGAFRSIDADFKLS